MAHHQNRPDSKEYTAIPIDDEKHDLKTEWTMAVAFRNVTPTDSWKIKAVSWIMWCSIVHTEILFRVNCKGKNCPYRNGPYLQNTQDKESDHKGPNIIHTIAFTVLNLPDDHHVRGRVHPIFPKDGAWTFLSIRMNHANVEKSLAFMMSQLGGDYNSHGYHWNYILGPIGYPIGVKAGSIKKISKDAAAAAAEGKTVSPKKWFCSEVVTATLMAGGFMNRNAIDRDPCTTHPEVLYNYLISVTAKVAPLKENCVWNVIEHKKK